MRTSGASDWHAIDAEEEYTQMLAHATKFFKSVKLHKESVRLERERLEADKESVRLERERLEADVASLEASKAAFLAVKKSFEDAREHSEAAYGSV